MKAFYLTLFLLISLISLGCAAPTPAGADVSDDDPQCPSSDPDCPGPGDYVDPDHPLPDYQKVVCSGHQIPEESRIKTMARMMDWCYCGNELNTQGLLYAGFSVYEDGIDPWDRDASRTWVCSKNKHEPCDNNMDWYDAWGNITAQCGIGNTGYFYDIHRQMAWGFETYQQKKFCDDVLWISPIS